MQIADVPAGNVDCVILERVRLIANTAVPELFDLFRIEPVSCQLILGTDVPFMASSLMKVFLPASANTPGPRR